MKRLLIILFAILLALTASGCNYYGATIVFDDSGYTYFVKVRDEITDEIRFYECNLKGDTRPCKQFKCDNREVYEYEDISFNYGDKEEALKEITRSGRRYFDPGDKEHELNADRIFKCNGEYYVSFWYNVNLHTPYGLFKYDKENETLNQILLLDDEKILDIKMP